MKNGTVALWCAVVAAGLVATAGQAADDRSSPVSGPREVVYLERSHNWVFRAGNTNSQVYLMREIVRQSLLIAARDELGLLTRDYWLGEAMPAAKETEALDLIARADPPEVELTRGTGAGRKTIERFEVPMPLSFDWPPAVERAEELSRTRWVELLKAAGYHGQPNRWKPEVTVPAETQRLLEEMTFTSQFLAIRQLHETVRRQGESAALLGAIVRGYANLGLLTEFHWHPAHKDFKARALLYAQRLMHRDVRPAWSRWHRAYALALTGLHACALTDMEEAEKQFHSTTSPDAAERPTWADLLNAYCRYQIDQLKADKIPPANAQLFQLLRYDAVEMSGSRTHTATVALEVLKELPECYRVHDGLYHSVGVAAGHKASVAGLLMVGKRLYSRLVGVADLPPGVRAILVQQQAGGGVLAALLGKRREDPAEEFQIRARLIDALLAAGTPVATAAQDASGAPTPDVDDKEFSWSVLGHLIQELSFVQVVRRAEFEREKLGVSPDAFLKATAPLVAKHRYHALAESYAWDAMAREKALEQLSHIDGEGVELTAYPMFDALQKSYPARSKALYKYASNRNEHLARELNLLLDLYPRTSPRFARSLLDVSPYSPRARAWLLEHDWKAASTDAAAWEKESSDHPAVLAALGQAYAAREDWAAAERCLRGAIKHAPAKVSYRLLADVYLKQGNEEQWLKTLEAFLDQPDYGLDHASVQEQMAKHYVGRGDWDKALPHALAAAECYSAWGLIDAGYCYEGLQDWSKAEGFLQKASERYRGRELVWYYFCRRTGQGDSKAAYELARRYLDQPHEKSRDMEFVASNAYVDLLEGRPAAALTGLEKCFADLESPYWGLDVALLADELKEFPRRDAALRRIRTDSLQGHRGKTESGWREMVDLAVLLADDLASEGKGNIDQAAVEKICAKLKPGEQMVLDYFLARYLDLHGHPTEAIDLWKRSMGYTIDAEDWVMGYTRRTLAGAELLHHLVEPDQYKDLLRPKTPASENAKASKSSGDSPASTDDN